MNRPAVNWIALEQRAREYRAANDRARGELIVNLLAWFGLAVAIFLSLVACDVETFGGTNDAGVVEAGADGAGGSFPSADPDGAVRDLDDSGDGSPGLDGAVVDGAAAPGDEYATPLCPDGYRWQDGLCLCRVTGACDGGTELPYTCPPGFIPADNSCKAVRQ